MSKTHIIHEPLFTFAWKRAKRVQLILFSEDGKILVLKKDRSFDLLRGFCEWDDDTLEDTARREAKEQASATLDTVTIAAVLATLGDKLADVTYELIMTAYVTSKGPRRAWQETESAFLDKETFLTHYTFGDREEMEVLIGMAEDFRVKKKHFSQNGNEFFKQAQGA